MESASLSALRWVTPGVAKRFTFGDFGPCRFTRISLDAARAAVDARASAAAICTRMILLHVPWRNRR
jgi:hypothetical protein